MEWIVTRFNNDLGRGRIELGRPSGSSGTKGLSIDNLTIARISSDWKCRSFTWALLIGTSHAGGMTSLKIGVTRTNQPVSA